jgi:hypothetical protein
MSTMQVAQAQQADVLASLTQQLSSQMDYASQLLENVSQLEAQHSAFQKAAHEKQIQLRQALVNADLARAEAIDARKKLSASQEIAARAAEEVKAVKAELSVLHRQVETYEQMSNESTAELQKLRDERDALRSHADIIGAENRRLAAAASDNAEDASNEIQRLSQQVALQTRELAEVKGRQAPLEAELETVRSAASRAREDGELQKRLRAEASSKLDRASLSLATSEAALRESQLNEARLGRSLEEETQRREALARQVHSLEQVIHQKDIDALTVDKKHQELLEQHKRTNEALVTTRRELEGALAELDRSVKARKLDRDEAEVRIASALEEIKRMSEESRARESQFATETAKRAAEVIAARREAEDARETSQEQISDLQNLVSKLRLEATERTRALEDARLSYEKRAVDTAHREAQSGAGTGRELAELRKQLAHYQQMEESIRSESENRALGFIDMLSALQAALKLLAAEVDSMRVEQAAVAKKASSLSSFIEIAHSQAPLDAWYNEAQNAFSTLVERIQVESKKVELEAERSRSIEIVVQDLKAQVLSLQDSLSRSEQEVNVRGMLLKDAQAAMQARDESSQAELRAAAAVAAELHGEVARIRERADKAQKGRAQLQEEALRAASELADAQQRHSARIAAFEAQAIQLEESLKEYRDERDAAEATTRKYKAELDAALAAAETARREKAAVEAEASRAGEVARQATTAYASQVAALSDGLISMERQSRQTTSLLALVQEQRKNLQEANQSLRDELDSIYSVGLQQQTNFDYHGAGGEEGREKQHDF